MKQSDLQMMAVASITIGDNVRRKITKEGLAELVASVRARGIAQPLLVRAIEANGKTPGTWELVAGHRRLAAAKEVGLTRVPVMIMTMTDDEALEFQLIENLQRTDLHALEEAAGYQRLVKAGHSVDRIARRTGKSTKYVYDRIKLLQLAPETRKLFEQDQITSGHAILLARLKPAEQKRIVKVGLFTHEHLLAGAWGRKPVSVRELERHIAEHVRLDIAEPDPELFPDLARVVTAGEKLTPITLERWTDKSLNALTPDAWHRADGKRGSKKCEAAELAVVVVGPGRGEIFRVCTQHETCKIHWAREQRAKRAEGSPAKRRPDRYQLAERKRTQRRALWTKARPAILAAVAARMGKLTSLEVLGDLLIRQVAPYDRIAPATKALVPRGKVAIQLVRHLAFLVLARDASDWNAVETFPPAAKRLGVDVRKHLAAVQTAAKAKAKPKPKKKRGAR